jgi:acyl carrier protein
MNQARLISELCEILGELEMTDGQLRQAEFDLRDSDNFDSISLSMFTCAIEDRYAVSLSIAELAESDTRLAHIAQVIRSKLEHAAGGMTA